MLLLDGAGVPAGTKPETCLACRGSGYVSSSSSIFCLVIKMPLINIISVLFVFHLMLADGSANWSLQNAINMRAVWWIWQDCKGEISLCNTNYQLSDVAHLLYQA